MYVHMLEQRIQMVWHWTGDRMFAAMELGSHFRADSMRVDIFLIAGF